MKNSTIETDKAAKLIYTAPCVVRIKDLIAGFGNCAEGTRPPTTCDFHGATTISCEVNGSHTDNCNKGNSPG